MNQQETMDKLNEEMTNLQKSRGDLTISAPHAGKLTEVAEIKVGDPMTSGTKIAQIVDDTKLKLSLYYSYAYENDISVGQSAQISIPATMTTRNATVEKINKVERITKEGLGEPIYDTAMMGSIVSNVSGYGTANAKDSATITLSQGGVVDQVFVTQGQPVVCLLYTSPSPRDGLLSRMPSSA